MMVGVSNKLKRDMPSADIETQNTALLLREEYSSSITTLPASDREGELNNITNVFGV
jgi:hypothetical protein